MPDVITPEERAMIDAAVAKGQVRHVPRGKSAFEAVENPATGRLVWVNTETMQPPGQPQFGFGRRLRATENAMIRRRERVRAAHARGWTTSQISQQLNISLSTVQADHVALGLKPHKPRKPAARPDQPTIEARRARVLKLARRGVRQQLIARKLGVSEFTVSKDVDRLRMAGAL